MSAIGLNEGSCAPVRTRWWFPMKRPGERVKECAGLWESGKLVRLMDVGSGGRARRERVIYSWFGIVDKKEKRGEKKARATWCRALSIRTHTHTHAGIMCSCSEIHSHASTIPIPHTNSLRLSLIGRQTYTLLYQLMHISSWKQKGKGTHYNIAPGWLVYTSCQATGWWRMVDEVSFSIHFGLLGAFGMLLNPLWFGGDG